MIPDNWKPLRAANRRMPLQEAYIRVEHQRDLMIIFASSSPLLTQWEQSRIYEEVNRMSIWLADHKIKMNEITQTEC